MSKKIRFEWVSFINDSEEYIGSYFSNKLVISYVNTEVDLNQMAEMARCIQQFKGVNLTLGNNQVIIKRLNTSIELVDNLYIGDYHNSYTVFGRGPNVQWLLNNRKEIDNLCTDKILYVDDMVVCLTHCCYHKDTVAIKLLDMSSIYDFIDEIEGTYVTWLDGTFDEFLETYGYTDEDTVRDISSILMVYQAAKSLGFKDPEEVAGHFGNKRLVVDLRMKAVFDDIRDPS